MFRAFAAIALVVLVVLVVRAAALLQKSGGGVVGGDPEPATPMSNLSKMYRLVFDSALGWWKEGFCRDGRERWQPLKKFFAALGGVELEWKTRPGGFSELLARLEECEKSGANERDKARCHFMAQVLRIPRDEEPSVRKVMQVALNAGQLFGMTGGAHEQHPNFALARTLAGVATVKKDAPAKALEELRALVA